MDNIYPEEIFEDAWEEHLKEFLHHTLLSSWEKISEKIPHKKKRDFLEQQFEYFCRKSQKDIWKISEKRIWKHFGKSLEGFQEESL